jgi:Xaa-Pro dipeptidase
MGDLTGGAARIVNADQEVTVKLERLRAWLEEDGCDAVLLASQSNFAWITAGGRSHISIGEPLGVGSVLVTSDDAFLVTTNIEMMRMLEEETPELGFKPLEYPWHEPDGVLNAIRRVCDPSRMVGDLPGLGLVDAGSRLAPLRYVLVAAEVERFRRLGRDAASAVETACRDARPGETEYDVAARVASECVRSDILVLVNLVASGDRVALWRHPLPTSNKLESSMLVALTGRRHGLHASLTRMVSFGKPDDDLVARHHSVTRVDARLIDASRPGASLGEVFEIGARAYAAEGFPEEWRNHHQGGLTGYGGREIFATPKSEHRLEAGESVAWNPSIMRVKSEDTILVREDSYENLTRTGSWPEKHVEVGSSTVPRPALMVQPS